MDLVLLLIVGSVVALVVSLILSTVFPSLPVPVYIAVSTVAFLAAYFACMNQLNASARRTRTVREKPVEMFRPQIAGTTCADCGQRIVFRDDGLHCAGCRRPYCRTCQPEVPCSHCREET